MNFERFDDIKYRQLRTEFLFCRPLNSRLKDGNKLIAKLMSEFQTILPSGRKIGSYLKHDKQNEKRLVKWLAVGRLLSSHND